MTRRLIALAALLVLAALPARAFDTRATHAWVYDVTTNTVLMDKGGEEPVPPASMSKLMTINMLFEALRDGRVTPETTFGVSARAQQMSHEGGSTMFLQQTDRPTVNDLLHGIIINSGNDACIVVAEGLAGTEEAFAAQMTERARAIGLQQSTFANSSGWPDPTQRMSMRDLGILAIRLIEEFPEYYPIFAQTEFDYKDRSPANRFNRNPLLKLDIGADGLKTGHTSESGYGLVGSAKQGDRRIVFAMNGLTSDKERAEEAERIVSWAFRQFTEKTIVKAGTRVAEAEVFMGGAPTVGLVPAADVKLLVPALVQETVTADVTYTGPLTAPLAQGAEVGTLTIHVPGLPDAHVPLVTETAVAKGGFLTRLMTAVDVLRARYIDGPAPAES
ncbi:D-alanyl-D-alanine carboxypeptidase family protein [Neotabrizicola shimadae]|uniref:serine-type D-Ala-D-Ala carboxypeptidase n=1 Tax=Neotabrizicola shimadae TaxID=2807096 RepID=A0A8G1EAZ7_9RHOB|nr:D-alanyl-D-alanine carboxypeptidase family protein [Neotabrizicola shimadae]QYZ68847.1 D-alanyl-D-alanine carboxypeptidase [Neotabrizicola shimadae]